MSDDKTKVTPGNYTPQEHQFLRQLETFFTANGGMNPLQQDMYDAVDRKMAEANVTSQTQIDAVMTDVVNDYAIRATYYVEFNQLLGKRIENMGNQLKEQQKINPSYTYSPESQEQLENWQAELAYGQKRVEEIDAHFQKTMLLQPELLALLDNSMLPAFIEKPPGAPRINEYSPRERAFYTALKSDLELRGVSPAEKKLLDTMVHYLNEKKEITQEQIGVATRNALESEKSAGKPVWIDPNTLNFDGDVTQNEINLQHIQNLATQAGIKSASR